MHYALMLLALLIGLNAAPANAMDSINTVWMNDGGARLQYDALNRPIQENTKGKPWIDPALRRLPDLYDASAAPSRPKKQRSPRAQRRPVATSQPTPAQTPHVGTALMPTDPLCPPCPPCPEPICPPMTPRPQDSITMPPQSQTPAKDADDQDTAVSQTTTSKGAQGETKTQAKADTKPKAQTVTQAKAENAATKTQAPMQAKTDTKVSAPRTAAAPAVTDLPSVAQNMPTGNGIDATISGATPSNILLDKAPAPVQEPAPLAALPRPH